MEPVQVILLALIQGLTEFLPISSSGHLLLPKSLLGWADQGLAFDVAVHLGTLVAVVFYFRRTLGAIVRDWTLTSLRRQGPTEHSRMGWWLILATLPAALAGLAFDGFIEAHLRSMLVVGLTTLLFGVALGWADWRGARVRTLAQLSWQVVLVIGLAQAIALIPGTSRSGITITAALLLGFTRQDAARFSFLMSVPVIALSGGYKALQLLWQSQPAPWGELALGAALAGVSAFVCIHYFMQYINRLGMLPFVIYRLLLGTVLLGLAVGLLG